MVVDCITQSHFLTLIRWKKINLREKKLFLEFLWPFLHVKWGGGPILRANFSHSWTFYSLRPYKDVRMELDLFPQITRTNSLYAMR